MPAPIEPNTNRISQLVANRAKQPQSHSPPKRETCSLTHHSQTRALHTSQYESHSSPHYDRDSEGVLIQVYHPNLHRTHITHTNGYILRSHALIQHTLVFAPLVVSIPAQYTVCQQYNSPDTIQQQRTVHTPTDMFYHNTLAAISFISGPRVCIQLQLIFRLASTDRCRVEQYITRTWYASHRPLFYHIHYMM